MKKGFVIFLAILVVIVLTASSFAQNYFPFPDTGQTKCYNNTEEITCPQPTQPFYGQADQNHNQLLPSNTNSGQGEKTRAKQAPSLPLNSVEGNLIWKYQKGYSTSSPAIGIDGTIYVGSSDGYMYAINDDGTLKWRYKIEVGGIFSTPSIGDNGEIYFGTNAGTMGKSYIYAVSKEGLFLWRYEIGSYATSSAIDKNGVIYIGSHDGILYSLYPDGSLKWKYKVDRYSITGSPSIDANNNIYFGTEDGYLYALDSSGSLLWKYMTNGSVESPAIDSNGIIYVHSDKLYAFDVNGSKIWSYDLDPGPVWFSPVIGYNNNIYLGSKDGYLYSINHNGTLNWKFKANGNVNVNVNTPSIGNDGVIYFGSDDNNIYAINQDGTLRWSYKTNDIVWNSPAISENGRLYVASYDGFLYAIAITSNGLADTTWPSFRANNKNEGRVPSWQAWKTEIGIVNPTSTSTTGTLKGYNSLGTEIWNQSVNLPANSRRELDISTSAGTSASQIKSMRFDITSGQAVGYQKFYQSGKYRVGLEASPRANQDRLLIPHIASNNTWATGIGWMNTTNEAKTLQFSFDTGQQVEKNLPAGGHEAFTISSLFAETAQPNIGAAQISNGAGIVGLVLFGSNNTLSGVNLSDATTSTLYFPDASFDSEWLTGFSIYNPGNQAANLTLTYFNSQGSSIGTYNKVVEPNQKISGNPQTLNFPNGTTWFMAQSSQPVTGFTLIGSANSDQLGGFSVVNITASSGVFPKLESNGWNGITFVNPGQASVNVQVQARNNAGSIVASNNLDLNSGQKWQDQAEVLFPGQDISSATYISFTASGDVVGFQLNGSADGTMLDAIPALGGSHTGGQHLFFPHIAAE